MNHIFAVRTVTDCVSKGLYFLLALVRTITHRALM